MDVKALEKTKDNSQDFVNEVVTIGRIYHVNIIWLLGFCCDGTLRALIYKRCWQQVAAQDFSSVSLIGETLFTKG